MTTETLEQELGLEDYTREELVRLVHSYQGTVRRRDQELHDARVEFRDYKRQAAGYHPLSPMHGHFREVCVRVSITSADGKRSSEQFTVDMDSMQRHGLNAVDILQKTASDAVINTIIDWARQ